MKTKRALLAIATLCIATTSVTAQSTTNRPRDSQQSRVKEIHARYAPVIKAAQKQAKDSATRINETELAEVRNILTSEQQQTFDSYISGKKRARRGSGARLMPVKIEIPE